MDQCKTRPPQHKDAFHGMKLVTESTCGPAHDMHQWFCKELSGCILAHVDKDIDDLTKRHIIENEIELDHAGKAWKMARLDVLRDKTWRGRMRNHCFPRIVQASRVQKLLDDARKMDQKYMDEGFPRYLRKGNEKVKTRDTEVEIKNLLVHINKGDYEDPFGPSGMSFSEPLAAADCATKVTKTLPKNFITKLHNLIRLRGTNMAESSNKQINLAVSKQSRLGGALAEAKVALRVHDHNLKKDRKFGNMTGRNAKPVTWFLQEANDQIANGLPLLNPTPTNQMMKERAHFAKRMTYPPTDFIPEPLGLAFMTGAVPDPPSPARGPDVSAVAALSETEPGFEPAG